jgi:EAL domain-containing protein (putative c-di-GMP-specific phosphodiesterase class I)
MLEDLAPGQVNAMEVARREARQVAQKVLAELGQPAQLLGSEFVTTPSIGVVLFQGREKPDDLLKWADMAMYQAKAAGRNSVRFFDPDFQAQAEQRVQIEVDLRQALRASEFQMWLQPQFDRERRVVGAEALLRWPQPQRGWVSPVDFIPVAESSGLIVALGQWVLEQACLQLALWAQDPRSASWTLSVNVSARQFRHPDFVSHTLALLQRTGANPSRLRLELTESMLLDDVAQTIERMDLLQQQGIDFSLDDFGTGYSSLSYLKQLPFVELKVDKSFVRDLLVDVNDAVLTRTMIVLAHALGLSVLAEGVETAAQFDALAEQGCDLFQGYLLGRPVDVTAFDARWRIFG